jgi:hypothetical protein
MRPKRSRLSETVIIGILLGQSCAIASPNEYRIQDLICQPTFLKFNSSSREPLIWAYESNCSCKDRKVNDSVARIQANSDTGEVVASLASKDHGTVAWWHQKGCKVLDSENWDCSRADHKDNGILIQYRQVISNKQGRHYQSYLYPGEGRSWVGVTGTNSVGGWCYIKQGWSFKRLFKRLLGD